MSDSNEKSVADQKLVEQKVFLALRNKTVSKNYYRMLEFSIELDKGQSLGLIIKRDVVVGVKWDSPCLGLLQTGDILYSIDKQMFSEDPNKNKDLLSKINQTGGKHTVHVIRFKRRPTIKPILPKGYQPIEGFEYEWTVVYLIRGMTLGLDVRVIDKKVYVTHIYPDSIASMSLLIGECIIDVEGELVTSIPQLTSSMVRALDKNGQARLLVEEPGNDLLRNMLRAKIAAAMGPNDQKDLPLPPETRPWIEKGLAALREKDPKPIYRPPKSEKTKQRKTHFAEKTVEHSFFDNLQTSLIVKRLGGAQLKYYPDQHRYSASIHLSTHPIYAELSVRLDEWRGESYKNLAILIVVGKIWTEVVKHYSILVISQFEAYDPLMGRIVRNDRTPYDSPVPPPRIAEEKSKDKSG